VVTRRLASGLHGDIAIVATDLNPAMLETAAAAGTSRPVQWRQADAMQLPFVSGMFDAVVCQFGVMFFPDKPRAFAEARRVLKPGGVLLITFHIGQEIKHLDEWWEKPVDLDFAFYQPEEMKIWLKEAGYELEETLVREPNPEVEVATRRAYIFARKPTS